MAKTFSIGLTDIRLKITTLNGIAHTGAFSGTSAASAVMSIGEVAEGSTQISDEAPTETKFKGDYSDATLYNLFQRGDFTFETDIIEVDAAKFGALTGGTVTGKNITIPASAPQILGEAILVFDQGLSMIRIPNAQIVATYAGANVKTELFKLHLKVIALATKIGEEEIVAEVVLK